jgi:hypothetical protein
MKRWSAFARNVIVCYYIYINCGRLKMKRWSAFARNVIVCYYIYINRGRLKMKRWSVSPRNIVKHIHILVKKGVPGRAGERTFFHLFSRRPSTEPQRLPQST